MRAPPEFPGLIAASVWMKFSKVLMPSDAELAAAERRDDAHRHGLSHAERVADGKHDIADAQGIGVAESDRRDRPAFDLQHRDVRFGIGTDGFGFQLLAVDERYLDLVGRLDHVVIGENVPLGTHDHAGAEACRALRFLFEAVAEEMPEERIVEERMARRLDFFAGENVHDRGDGFFHRVAVGGRTRGKAG